MKDLFLYASVLYRQSRLVYPHSIIQEILKHVPHRQFVWDCGAGSGQFTQLLVPYFEQIVATDLNSQQLQQASYFENVSYQVQQAEKTSFADQSFDLITVAQAIHCFDADQFYAEAKRTLKEDGVLAVLGFGLIEVQDVELNLLIQQLYFDTLQGFDDVERAQIDHAYQTLPFCFEEIETPALGVDLSWSVEQLLEYLHNWSGLKHDRANNIEMKKSLATIVTYLDRNQDLIEIKFPIFMRLGKLKTENFKQKMDIHNSPVNKILKRVSLNFKTLVAA